MRRGKLGRKLPSQLDLFQTAHIWEKTKIILTIAERQYILLQRWVRDWSLRDPRAYQSEYSLWNERANWKGSQVTQIKVWKTCQKNERRNQRHQWENR